jgi:hypothetical protein
MDVYRKRAYVCIHYYSTHKPYKADQNIAGCPNFSANNCADAATAALHPLDSAPATTLYGVIASPAENTPRTLVWNAGGLASTSPFSRTDTPNCAANGPLTLVNGLCTRNVSVVLVPSAKSSLMAVSLSTSVSREIVRASTLKTAAPLRSVVCSWVLSSSDPWV